MSELRFVVMTDDIPSDFETCGNSSIDDRIREAYCKTLCKQGLAYNILVDGYLVGNCMIKLVCIRDEDDEYYVTDHEYMGIEISYIAIDVRVQRQGIGQQVLIRLMSEAKKMSEKLPIRFLVLDARRDKKQWYLNAGFEEYPKREDLRYPNTIPMRIDFIDKALAEQYAGLLP